MGLVIAFIGGFVTGVVALLVAAALCAAASNRDDLDTLFEGDGRSE